MEQKVSQYEEIKRKYGGSIKAAQEYKLKIKEQIGTNFSFEEKIEKLESIYLNSKNCYIKAAEDLSVERNKASEKMAKKINNYLSEMDMPEAKPILEINPKHKIVKKMNKMSKTKQFNDSVFLVYEQAILAENMKLDNPSEFINRMNRALEKAL